jgi:L-aminopeptidase/D-esterase-like protein
MTEPGTPTNDNTALTPRISFAGPVLTFDFPSLRIGVAEYDEGPTGCTVFAFAERAYVAADIRGGSYGTLYTSQLRSGDRWVNAICLAGGSFYGLEAAMGVAAEILATRNYSSQWEDIARVAGAVIYDSIPRDNLIYPDKTLGRAAMAAARQGVFPLGARGAGRSATVGKVLGHCWESAGQGAAFAQIGPTRIAVFTVVNAVGAIVDRAGGVVRGFTDPDTGTRHSVMAEIAQFARQGSAAHQGNAATDARPLLKPVSGNTTLTVVVTNQRLTAFELRRLAKQTHTSMARAIQPFHTVYDGDVLYAVTTNEVENPDVNMMTLPIIASELAWDAVLSSVPA